MKREVNVNKLKYLVFMSLLFLGCIQNKEGREKNVSVKNVDTLIFLMNEEGISSRKFQDSYQLGAYTFKAQKDQPAQQVIYKDIKEKIVSSDSFLKRWNRGKSEGIRFEYYLFMDQNGLNGKLIPLDSNWHGSMLIRLDSIVE